jgi:exonuclease III
VRGSIDRCVLGINGILDHDVLVTTETWLTSSSAARYKFPIQGFSHFYTCRGSKKEHGGVSVFVKDKLKATVVEKQVNPDLLALSLGNNNLLLVAAYASPRNSANGQVNVFEDIASMIIRSPKHTHVALIGDLNAHVGELNRCTSPRDFVHFRDLIGREQEMVPIHLRKSKDKRVTLRGRECIQFCEQMGMDIVNGCQGLGDDEGEVTWESTNGRNDTGVIDLCIVTSDTFQAIKEFKVADYTGLSDHRHICCVFDVPYDLRWDRSSNRPKPRGPMWVQKEWQKYANQVNAVLPKIGTLLHGIKEADLTTVEAKSHKVCKLLQNCAREVFRKHHHTGDSNRAANMVTRGEIVVTWWDTECEHARAQMMEERCRCKSLGLKCDMGLRHATLSFKSLIKRKRREAEVKADLELVDSLKWDPWKFWGKLKDKKQRSELSDPNEAARYFQGLLNKDETSDVFTGFETDVSRDGTNVAELDISNGIGMESLTMLNSPITSQEVILNLKGLRNGKSSADGFRAELFKYVKMWNEDSKKFEYPIAQNLADLFNACFLRQQGIPQGWRKAFITPIYKGSGPKDSLDHHRGITVMTSLYKLYCSILGARLNTVCEVKGLRAESQCGFRKNMGTISAIFVLQYAICATCSTIAEGGCGLPLFVAFVDFQKAFDSLLRSLLWTRLHKLGLRGNILHAIMDFYKDTVCQVKINGKLSEEKVVSTTGVKQGCPLSPLLFGLFIEQLDIALREIEGVLGITISDQELRDLLYADDAALMSPIQNGLQKLVDCLHDFSNRNNMRVNTTKTEVVVFVPQRKDGVTPSIDYNGTTLPNSTEFRYLGVHVHNKQWLALAGDKLAEKASKAMWALCSKMDGLGVKCMEVKLRLFEMLVMSIGNYGCQVWGVNYLRLDSDAHVFNNPLQKVVLLYLRTISGAYRNTSRWVLLNEFGLLPTQVTWACLCARWWNKCLDGHNGTLMQKIIKQDIELFCKGNDKCWSAKFLICMGRLELLHGRSVGMLRAGPRECILSLRFSESAVKEALVVQYARLQNISTADPRTAPSLGLALLKHTHWFAIDEAKHLKFSAPQSHMRSFYKFRLGSLQLRCYEHDITPRAARVCTLCSSQLIEDEKHMIFECEKYECLRRDPKWASLFNAHNGLDMKMFMNQDDQVRLCSFIHYLLRFRSQCLQASTTETQGTLERHLQLDMFDSSSSANDSDS